MTGRINSFLVVLDNDMCPDDAEPVLTALRMVRGVAAVTANVSDPMLYVERTRARLDLEAKLWKALREGDGK